MYMSKFCKGHDIVKSDCCFYCEDGSSYCNVHSKNVKECAICLNEIELYSCEKIVFHKNIAYEVSCGHVFHYKCIEQMFMGGRTPKCPLCRVQLDEDPMYIHIKRLEHNIKEQERYNTGVLLDIQTSQRRTENNGRRLLDAFLGLTVQDEPPTTPSQSPSVST